MRNQLLTAGLTAALGLAVGAAQAAPITPQGPIFIQSSSAEQFSETNNIGNAANPANAGLGAAAEGNWGIIQVSTIQSGTVLPANPAPGTPPPPYGNDIGGGGPIVFASGQSGGNQITGIFYNIQNTAVGAGGTSSTGGYLDLYWWDVNNQNVSNELNGAGNLAKRTAQNEYTGFTCANAPGGTSGCTFLARLNFAGGADPSNYNITISSPTDVSTGNGTSKSYLSVDTSAGGAWANVLNSNFFTTDANGNPVGTAAGGAVFQAQDVRLDNNFTHVGAWSVTGTDIISLRDNDPARAYAVPEPASLALISLGLLGLGFGMRRKAA